MIKVTHNIAEFQEALTRLAGEHMPQAAARALSETALEARNTALPDEMKRVFDRPTAFTLRAYRMERATPQNLQARLLLKDMQAGRHFLKVQVHGGDRPLTALERLLQSRVQAMDGRVGVTPASGARRDAYGNWSVGERNQALSAIQAQRDVLANTTAASRARAKGKRADYFVPKPGSRLSPGIWKRQGKAAPVKVVHFTASDANYEKRFDPAKVVAGLMGAPYAALFRRRLAELLR